MKKAIVTLLVAYLISPVSVMGAPGTRGMKVKTREGTTIQLYGGSYALVIGNGNYQKGWDRLKGAVSDAREVAEALEKHGFEVTLRTDVTKDEFDREFGQFAVDHGRDKDNRLLFYYAGHGYTEKMATGEELGYIVMVDTPTPETDPVGFDVKSVDMVSVATRAKKLNVRHVLFMFDSCFAGSILNLREKITPESISDNIRYPVRQFITAGRADEPVPDYSVFKQAFLDLIERRDKEPIPDGYITGEELGLYLKTKVPEYNPNQHPQYGKIKDPKLDKGDFVFQLPQPTIPSPPSGSGFVIDDLTEEADRIEAVMAVKAAWGSQLREMEKAYGEATAYEKRDVSPGLKTKVWERFLEAFKEDNPYSAEDGRMREKASQQAIYWQGQAKLITETEPSTAPVRTRIGKDGAEMVLIPAGEFEMGTDSSEVPQWVQWQEKQHFAEESYRLQSSLSIYLLEYKEPPHTVFLDAFYMDRYEVTNALYKKFVDATGHKAPGYWNDFKNNAPDHPVVSVSWNDAKAYADWAGKRLPTEAQWKKAARGGLAGKRFPWGDSDPDGSQCNFADKNTDYDWSDKSVDDGYQYTAPVGSFTPNGYGLYDMAGNVHEWCADWYGETQYSGSPSYNPTGPSSGTSRFVCGGSLSSPALALRVAQCHTADPSSMNDNNGFRCVSRD